jgi:hypothetical protein
MGESIASVMLGVGWVVVARHSAYLWDCKVSMRGFCNWLGEAYVTSCALINVTHPRSSLISVVSVLYLRKLAVAYRIPECV